MSVQPANRAALCATLIIAVAHAADIIVIEPTGDDERVKATAPFVKTVTDALAANGIAFDKTTDAEVASAAALAKHKLALFPHATDMSADQIGAIERFVKAGGKIIVFYGLSPRIAALLGIKYLDYVQSPEGVRPFLRVQFATDGPVKWLPEQMEQDSWNVSAFEPLAGGAQVLGRWVDGEGTDSGYAAVSVNENGAFMGHVLTKSDRDAKARFVLALVGHFLPGVWTDATERVIAASERLGRFDSIAELTEFCGKQRKLKEMRPFLDRSRTLRLEAKTLFDQQQYPAAIEKAEAARRELEVAYPRLYPPREGEMRGVWVHSPFYVPDWDAACRHLRDCGFNAVFVNMCNAGNAFYPSKYLRLNPRAEEHGDQIARVLAACRKYGIELHVWRVCWNVWGNPEKVKRIQDEGKCTVSYKGRKSDRLCPSWPENRQHEVDTMLEIVRNYDVPGIHFDYIRYGNGSYCYCDHCRQVFEGRVGRKVATWPDDVREGELKEPYLQFRRDNITAVVKEVSEKSRALKPWVKVSAAVWGYWPGSRVSIAQDSAHWVREGYLDFICPMNYTTKDSDLAGWTSRQVREVAGRIPLYIGLGAWQHTTPAKFADQIALSRELGADGIIAFSYEHANVRRHLTACAPGITAGETYQPHWAPESSFSLPDGDDEAHPFTYRVGTRLAAAATLTTKSTLQQPLQRVWSSLELRDTSGNVLRRLGVLAVKGDERTKSVTFAAPAGRFRLVLDGRMEFTDGTARKFVTRSAMMTGLTAEEIAARDAADELVEVEGAGDTPP